METEQEWHNYSFFDFQWAVRKVFQSILAQNNIFKPLMIGFILYSLYFTLFIILYSLYAH